MTPTAPGNAPGQLFDRSRWERVSGVLAVALAASLPWSTTATGILAALWLLSAVPTFDAVSVRRDVLSLAGGLPVLFWLLGVVGMAWAFDATGSERIGGLSAFHKVLFIPLLMIQFRRSSWARCVLIGLVISCTLLLIASWVLRLAPGLTWRGRVLPGIPVKNYASQADLFTFCAFALGGVAIETWRGGRRRLAAWLSVLAIMFLVNILYVATSRTALVVCVVLVLVSGFRWFSWKGVVGALIAAIVCATVAWTTSPFLRLRVNTLFTEIQQYERADAHTSAGERLEFWTKSLRFIAQAPLVGHGTGSIPQMFRSAASAPAMAAVQSTNPHNQTFAVAIQLGLVGTALLYAMWLSHLWLFRGAGLAAWIGLIVVCQNVVGSLFNSLLFDFTQGWLYVLGVGIAGGVVLGGKAAQAPPAQPR